MKRKIEEMPRPEDRYFEESVDPLLKWYDKKARELPWRTDPKPYYVWVSEIMLQQTRVEAVKPYFSRFIERLPGTAELAACPEDQLLKLWEGLGYYNRVRNMQKAARIIEEDFGGKIPSDYETLLTLPGIGNYTAGAIASIACGKAAPAVDGNVFRVYSRITRMENDISSAGTRRLVENAVMRVIPRDRPGKFNQSLMELGATVCLPNGRPACEECPVKDHCLAGTSGTWAAYPRKKAAAARRIEDHTVLILRYGSKVALQKRPDKGLLAGLYQFPNPVGRLSAQQVEDWLRDRGLKLTGLEDLPPAKHIFSHIEWHMTGYYARVEEPVSGAGDLIFVEVEETEGRYPVPAAFAFYRGLLGGRST